MKRSPLRKVSKSPHRRLKRFVPVKIIEAIHERSGGRCEFVSYNEEDGIEYRCTEAAERTPHHLLKRSQGGGHTLENCKASCWYHNQWAEIEPKKAIKAGWVIPYKGYKR